MQIDLQFYLRLAQCQAKCAEKCGTSAKVRLLDGNLRSFMNWSSPLVELCREGCLDADTPSTASRQQSSTAQHPSALAFQQGQLFFRQTAPGNPFYLSPPIASQPPQIHRIRPLCSQRLTSPEGLLKSTLYKAVMAIDMTKEDKRGSEQPLRFVVQWRRKVKESPATEEPLEEAKWITASIESDRTFHVMGIRAGHLHQFAVQTMSPSGPLGASVHSRWIDFDELVEPVGPMGRTSLQFFARYNMDNGVAALVRWRRDGEEQLRTTTQLSSKPILRSRLRRHHRHLRNLSPPPTQFMRGSTASAAEDVMELKAVSEFRTVDDALEPSSLPPSSSVVFPACRLQIEWANKSTRTVDEFELDGSDGFLLRHLAFNSEYAVRLLPGTSSSADQPPSPWWNAFHGTFLSMHCSQVFGSGSLECDPEPVRELKVVPSVENGSALVSWERPEELDNILLYEVGIEPVAEVNPGKECEVKPSARIVSAQSNSVLISLPQGSICEFHVQVVVYDLLGRDALSQQRFSFIPLGASLWPQPPPMEFLANLDGSVLALLSVVVFVPMAAMVTLICTFSHQSTQRKAIRQKLPGGGEMGKKRPEGAIGALQKMKMVAKGKKGKKADKTEKEKRWNAKLHQCNSPQSTLTTESTVAGTAALTTPPAAESGTASGESFALDGEDMHKTPGGGLMRWMTETRRATPATPAGTNGAIV
uniref:Fibronectin type-III domain-containing protein n=1 Tax=Globodera pallida TaxID=36090 RepID=A0A183BL31_GLOPA